MKISKTLLFQGRQYDFLSDNTQDLDERTLFVNTPRNQKFLPQVLQEWGASLEFKELIHHFKIPEKIIGITGTNGKTTTANLIYSSLKFLGKNIAMLGTQGLFYNGKQLKPKGLTTPGILELYEDLESLVQIGCEILVMEVSSHAIDQKRIYGLEFCAKILTQITSDHLDYHKSIEEYIRVKNSFFDDDCLKIINQDEKKAIYNSHHSYTYGFDERSDLSVKNFSFKQGISADLCLKINDFKQELKLLSPLYGKHNLSNLMAAFLCVEVLFGKDIKVREQIFTTSQILESFWHFSGVSGRMEVISQDPLVIVDFAHTHDGMQKIFESFEDRDIVVVFGAGGDRDKTKRPLMGEVASRFAKKIFITSDNPRTENPLSIIDDIVSGIKDKHKITIEPDRKKAIQDALKSLKRDEVLLILGKGDETYQILKDKTIEFDDRVIVREMLFC